MATAAVDSPRSVMAAAFKIVRARPGPRLRRAVLAAVLVGVAFGAMTCAAGMAVGNGHNTVAGAPVDQHSPAADAHADHSAVARVVEAGAASQHAASEGNDGDHRSTTSSDQNHPGMACVVSLDLRVPEPTPTSVTDAVDNSVILERSDCVADVEPPVPRIS